MSNLMLGFPNLVDQATLSGGSWVSSLPLSNIQNKTIGRVARTTDDSKASASVKMDFSSSKKVRALSAVNHNLSINAKYRIRVSNEGAATKCLPGNDDLTDARWGQYLGGTATVSVQALTDAVMGTYFRITKTGGAVNDRAGINNGYLTGFSGSQYAAGCWVRRGTATTSGAAPYVDANGTLGLLTAVCSVNSSLTVGVWTKLAAANNNPYGAGNSLTGSGTAYLWVDSYVGDYIDVKFPDVELGAINPGSAVAVPWGAAPYTRPAGYIDSWQSYDYDSGWTDAWPVVYASGVQEWEDDNWWTGKYTADEMIGYTPSFVHIAPKDYLARGVRVDFDDTLNPSNYVQIGRIFIGPVWQPSVNLSTGAALGWETDTDIQKAIGGAEYFQRRTPYRVSKFVINYLQADEAFGKAFEVLRRAGVDQEVLFIHDPDDTVHALRRRFLGRFRQLNPVEYPYPQNNSVAMEIKERL